MSTRCGSSGTTRAKIKQYSFGYLMEFKGSHSKMKNIKYKELKLQDYFKNNNLSVENKRDLFSFRTRMADFGEKGK